MSILCILEPLTLEDGTDKVTGRVEKGLPLLPV